MKKNFTFTSEIWIYPGLSGNWHFTSLPKDYAKQIKESYGQNLRGWRSIRIEAKIGKTKWNTSIFPDKRSETYILPIKKGVREAEGIRAKQKVKVTLQIIK